MPTLSEDNAFAQHRGKWSHRGVPHTGWECVEIEDLGEPSQVCDMCESQTIRYAHHMFHANYPDVLVVGCVCAGHMEGDIGAARQRERQMGGRAARRRRWLTRSWRLSAKGNEYLRADGFVVTVYPKRGAWAATVSSDERQFVQHSQRRYASSDAAKLAAFDLITRILAGE